MKKIVFFLVLFFSGLLLFRYVVYKKSFNLYGQLVMLIKITAVINPYKGYSNIYAGNLIKKDISSFDPKILHNNISDLEKTSILRRWVSKNTQWDGLNNVIPTEFDLDENARMYKLLKKQPKLLCQPIARILTQLYDLYEIKSYRYHFGLLEQWNHVFNLVQIKWKNKTILAIQDASFNIEYLNENGDPYDFFEFLQLLKNKKDLYLSFYQENFLVKVRCYDNLNKCSYIDDESKTLHLRFRITTLEKNIKALTYPRKIDSTRDFDKASKIIERIKTILKT